MEPEQMIIEHAPRASAGNVPHLTAARRPTPIKKMQAEAAPHRPYFALQVHFALQQGGQGGPITRDELPLWSTKLPSSLAQPAIRRDGQPPGSRGLQTELCKKSPPPC